jgi:two-component system CheB/CheR fusion protein
MIALRDEDGKLAGFGKVLRNRTDLREQMETLRNQVEAANTMVLRKDVFLSTLSHELRNPLSPLLHAAEIIRRKVPPGTGIEDDALPFERRRTDLDQGRHRRSRSGGARRGRRHRHRE